MEAEIEIELHVFRTLREYDVTQMLRFPAPQSISSIKPEDFFTIPINMRWVVHNGNYPTPSFKTQPPFSTLA